MLNANQIKAHLIDFLLANSSVDLIATEVPFYSGYRKADLIELKDNKTIAYEIKSERDNLHQIEFQIQDYLSTFSFCYLVTTKKHLGHIRKVAPKKVGLILWEKYNFSVIRKAQENKRLSKHSLSLGMACSKLTPRNTINAHEYFEKEFDTEYLRVSFNKHLIIKYQSKYLDFLSDRGGKTTLSDLYYLQGL